MDTKKNILIVSPHADDEILGCGGIIARYSSEGNNVFIAIMCNAHVGAPDMFPLEKIQKIRSDAVKAHQLLKVKQTFFFDFPAPRLDTYPSFEISNVVANLIFENSIDILFIPHKGDIHQDHRVVHQASLVAARPVNNCPVKEIYAYETLSETEWSSPTGTDAFIPTVFIDITDFLSSKLEAMSCYTTQIRLAPHSRSLPGLTHLAHFRGSTIGRKCAEAFMLIRSIQ
jgi:LmbE family N-acetylglucosaminyl deacetylase